MADSIHLTTGIWVCGKPKLYCNEDPQIDHERSLVLNATASKKRATCSGCLEEYDKAMAEIERRYGVKPDGV